MKFLKFDTFCISCHTLNGCCCKSGVGCFIPKFVRGKTAWHIDITPPPDDKSNIAINPPPNLTPEINKMNVNYILKEREETHGDFTKVAQIAQEIKDTLDRHSDGLPPVMLEAFDLFGTKIARIIEGDERNEEHWVDLVGYATLVLNYLKKTDTKKVNVDCCGSVETFDPTVIPMQNYMGFVVLARIGSKDDWTSVSTLVSRFDAVFPDHRQDSYQEFQGWTSRLVHSHKPKGKHFLSPAERSCIQFYNAFKIFMSDEVSDHKIRFDSWAITHSGCYCSSDSIDFKLKYIAEVYSESFNDAFSQIIKKRKHQK